jgi:hypothetical protein
MAKLLEAAEGPSPGMALDFAGASDRAVTFARSRVGMSSASLRPLAASQHDGARAERPMATSGNPIGATTTLGRAGRCHLLSVQRSPDGRLRERDDVALERDLSRAHTRRNGWHEPRRLQVGHPGVEAKAVEDVGQAVGSERRRGRS